MKILPSFLLATFGVIARHAASGAAPAANDMEHGALPEYVTAKNISGTVRVWGLHNLGPGGLGAAWAAGFQKIHPGASVEVARENLKKNGLI